MTTRSEKKPGPLSQRSVKISGGYLILVVDDEPDIRTLLSEYLKREGFRVIEAENGREAIDVARQEQPRLILMNYMMPVMDGLIASRLLHEDPELGHIPIILNSLCDEDEMRAKAKRAGCVDFIAVPFSPREVLRSIVRHVLVG
jgi:CheY-like chemotaxis protein